MRLSQSSLRPAYTLLEIILVMALIVIMGAISVPLIESMLSDSRIVAAGDEIRGRMAEARARAMDEGRPWKFAYLPGSRLYQLAPEDSDEWKQQSQDLADTAEVVRDELPKETYFGQKHEDIMNGSEPPTPGPNWETAAIFMPDGTARDDTVTYFGKMGFAPRRVRLRGLTGVVSVDAVRDSKGGQP